MSRFNHKLNVLLLNPPGSKLYIRDNYCSFSAKADYYWPPIDFLVLSGILKQAFNVFILDCIIDNISEDKCLQSMADLKIQVVIFLTGTASWVEDIRFMQRVYKNFHLHKIIAIGGHLLKEYRRVLAEYDFLDAVLTNYAINNIVDYLQNESIDKLENIQTRLNCNNHIKPSLEFSYPVPLYEKFNLEKYKNPFAKNKTCVSVLTTYGCPFKCSFCIGSSLGYAKRNSNNLLFELKHIKKTGIREIWFNDCTFNINEKHVKDVCRLLIDWEFSFSWFCQCHAGNISADMVKLMKQAGCHTVQLGIESASDRILTRYNKKITVANVRSSVELFKKYGIKILGYFMLGLPDESESEIKQMIKLAKELDCDYASFSIATPDFGTELREECIREGWIETDAHNFDSSQDTVINYGIVQPQKIIALRNLAVKQFYLRPAYIFKKLITVTNLREIKILLFNGLKLIINSFFCKKT